MKKILVLLVSVLILAGCNRPLSKTSVSPTPNIDSIVKTAVSQAMAAQPTQGPQLAQNAPPFLTPVAQSTAEVVKPVVFSNPFDGLDTCPYKDTGSPQPEKLDVSTFKLSDGRMVYALDLSKLPGCAIVFEGRFPWQTNFAGLSALLEQSQILGWDLWDVHFIVDIRSALGNFDPTPYNELVDVPDQYKTWLVYSEGSIWFYDPTWNVSNLKVTKPSLAQEFEAKKFRDAMVPGEYNFPRVIMQPTGQMFAFWQTDSGNAAYTNGTAAGCTKTNQPELIPVYGLWDGSQFSAAIGAGNCRMVYWADGAIDPVVWNGYQKDGKTIVSYQNSVIAYMFPAVWTDDQVNTWLSSHPGGK